MSGGLVLHSHELSYGDLVSTRDGVPLDACQRRSAGDYSPSYAARILRKPQVVESLTDS
ncbi:hypothetical protein NSERUTF1_2405 [Nocardia seriolae]|nr:hypothetical protein NSERUTF1_2405 [Nocardia seriolae]